MLGNSPKSGKCTKNVCQVKLVIANVTLGECLGLLQATLYCHFKGFCCLSSHWHL